MDIHQLDWGSFMGNSSKGLNGGSDMVLRRVTVNMESSYLLAVQFPAGLGLGYHPCAADCLPLPELCHHHLVTTPTPTSIILIETPLPINLIGSCGLLPGRDRGPPLLPRLRRPCPRRTPVPRGRLHPLSTPLRLADSCSGIILILNTASFGMTPTCIPLQSTTLSFG